MGKKIGIAAMICAILFSIFSIIALTQEPEIPKDVLELVIKDKEAYTEKEQEIEDGASTLYKVSGVATTITGLGGIVLAIVSIVKLVKAKEKGKIVPILAIVLIVIFFIAPLFFSKNSKAAFEAGLSAGMEM